METVRCVIGGEEGHNKFSLIPRPLPIFILMLQDKDWPGQAMYFVLHTLSVVQGLATRVGVVSVSDPTETYSCTDHFQYCVH